MTKRERRYHQRKQLHRRLRHASHILSCGIQNLIRSMQPRPKYPLGTFPVCFAGGNLQEVIQEQMKEPRPNYPVWNIDNI